MEKFSFFLKINATILNLIIDADADSEPIVNRILMICVASPCFLALFPRKMVIYNVLKQKIARVSFHVQNIHFIGKYISPFC